MLSVASYQEQIAQIAVDVFNSMLRMEVAICDKPAPSASDVAALVRFRGSWNGALLIQCSFDQAFELTSRLMQIDRPTCFDEDVMDTLGEVANMIGGNLKALLSPRTALSVPEVFSMTPTYTGLPKDWAASTIALQSEEGAFFVTLSEQPFPAVGESGRCVEVQING